MRKLYEEPEDLNDADLESSCGTPLSSPEEGSHEPRYLTSLAQSLSAADAMALGSQLADAQVPLPYTRHMKELHMTPPRKYKS